MESMEESWENWFQDLEISGDFVAAFGAHDEGLGIASSSQENFESCWNNNADTTLNAENGIIITSDPSTSKSVRSTQQQQQQRLQLTFSHDSVLMLEEKAYFDDSSSNGYFMSQTNINKERDNKPAADGRTSRVQEHLLAERMRRGKISQHFISLSALIPGLKRADKASVLEGAIKHVKQLQEQVKALEEQQKKKKKKKNGESVMFVKKSQLISTDTTTTSFNDSSDPSSKCNSTVAEADVEARVSDKNVLIRVQCEKQEGIMVKTIKEIEKLNLSVVNSSVMPFGRSIVDITIVAEMEDEFNLSCKELARKLRVALLQST